LVSFCQSGMEDLGEPPPSPIGVGEETPRPVAREDRRKRLDGA
jgi:hypothetical protein